MLLRYNWSRELQFCTLVRSSADKHLVTARLCNQRIPSLTAAAALKVFQTGSIRSQEEIRLGWAASFLQSQMIRFACSHEMVFSSQLSPGMQRAACCCCSKELPNLSE